MNQDMAANNTLVTKNFKLKLIAHFEIVAFLDVFFFLPYYEWVYGIEGKPWR